MKPLSIAFILTLFLTVPSAAIEPGSYAGIFNSPKGIGLCVDIPSNSTESFNSFSLVADIYGVPLGRALYPGVKGIWLHNWVTGERKNSFHTLVFYSGIGLSAGYLHDFEREGTSESLRYLKNDFGVSAAVAANTGFRCDFGRRLTLDLSVCTEIGAHVLKQDSQTVLRLYKNGLIQTLYPQLKILWRL